MSEFLHTVFRLACVGSGGMLLYAAAFLYENEEGRIQNTLQDWWIRIDDLEHVALSRHTAFLQIVASLAASTFDKLFGKKLWSTQAVFVSTCYSLVSIIICLIVFYPKDFYYEGSSYFWLLTFLVLGSAGGQVENRTARVLWYILVSASVGAFFVGTGVFQFFLYTFNSSLNIYERYTSGLITSTGVFFAAMSGAVASDFLLATWTRQMVSMAANATSFVRILVIVTSNALLATLFVGGPLICSRLLSYSKVPIARSLELIGQSNTYACAVASVFFVVAFLLLAHRIAWPLVNRPLYALVRFNLLRQRKMLAVAGTSLIAVALPGVASVLHDVFGL